MDIFCQVSLYLYLRARNTDTNLQAIKYRSSICLSLFAGPFPGIFVPEPSHDLIDIRARGLFFSCHKEAGAVNEALSSDIFALSLVLLWQAMQEHAPTALLDLPRQSHRCFPSYGIT